MVRQTHSGCFTGGRSAVVCVFRRKCVVGKLPCNALAFVWALAQTDCQALATSHLGRLFFHVNVWMDGPCRRHSFKRRQHHEDAVAARTKRPNKRAFWTSPFGTTWQSLFLCARLPEGRQKNKSQNSKSNRIFLCSHNSAGCKVRSTRASVGRFLASPHARDDVEPRPPWRTPSCDSLGNHLQQQKHHEQTVTQTAFERCSHAQSVMETSILDRISEMFKTVFFYIMYIIKCR